MPDRAPRRGVREGRGHAPRGDLLPGGARGDPGPATPPPTAPWCPAAARGRHGGTEQGQARPISPGNERPVQIRRFGEPMARRKYGLEAEGLEGKEQQQHAGQEERLPGMGRDPKAPGSPPIPGRGGSGGAPGLEKGEATGIDSPPEKTQQDRKKQMTAADSRTPRGNPQPRSSAARSRAPCSGPRSRWPRWRPRRRAYAPHRGPRSPRPPAGYAPRRALHGSGSP